MSQDGGRYEPKAVGQLKVNNWMINPDSNEVCRIHSVDHSKPGKHGAAKARMELVGLFTGKKSEFLAPVDKRVNVPIIDKRNAQVTNITGDSVQLMDSETFENYEVALPIEEDLREKLVSLHNSGKTVQVEIWDVMNRKKIMDVRSMEVS